MINFGIRKVLMKILKPSRIYFHTKGTLKSEEQHNYLPIPLKAEIRIGLDYEVFNMLDFQQL